MTASCNKSNCLIININLCFVFVEKEPAWMVVLMMIDLGDFGGIENTAFISV